MSYFSDLGLAEPILRALGTKGYSDPTPIQRQAIPALIEGRDLLGIAQTGTGKTAAFSLPSLHRLAANPKPRLPASCRMLVLSPTRELAAQIAENMRGYAKNLALSVQCIFGGVPVGKQARALVPGVDILVATPGRLLDLIDQRALTLRNVEIFVLDEADQMMDLGFIVPLKRVANMLPKERQSLFFSATMPKAIADLGRQFINNPVRVEVTPQATTAERVEQYATFVNQAEKQALLTIALRAGLADGSIDRALVFSRTKHGADRVVRHLESAGVAAAAIHGNKSQGQRTAALGGFRTGAIRILVATDIAARGIDVTGVSHVFNFEMPNVPEQYVHRIGRTARAGADGVATSYVAPDEKAYLKDIERLTGIQLMRLPLPEDFAKEAAKLPAPSKKAISDAESSNPHARGGRNAGGRRDGAGGRRPERAGGEGRHGEARRAAKPGEVRRFDEGRPAPTERRTAEAGRPGEQRGRPEGERHQRPQGERHQRPQGERPQGERARVHGEGRPQPQGERARPQGEHRARPHGERPHGERPQGERRDGPRQDGGRHGGNGRADAGRPAGNGGRPAGGGRPGGGGRGGQFRGQGGDRSSGTR